MSAHALPFLFTEDFGVLTSGADGLEAVRPGDDAAAEPVRPEPSFTQADITASYEAGYAAGRADAQAAAETDRSERVARALATMAECLEEAGAATARVAEATADALGQLVLGALAVAYPLQAARHGEAEMRRFIAAILPPLRTPPWVRVRVHPDLVEAAAEQIATLRLRDRAPLTIEPDAEMAFGDAAIDWERGGAARSAQAGWDAVVDALAAFGLTIPPTLSLVPQIAGSP